MKRRELFKFGFLSTLAAVVPWKGLSAYRLVRQERQRWPTKAGTQQLCWDVNYYEDGAVSIKIAPDGLRELQEDLRIYGIQSEFWERGADTASNLLDVTYRALGNHP